MEISTATNATNIAAVASNTKSPDADFETPVRIHSSNTKPLTFTNGVLKRHQPLHHHHHHGGTGTGTTNIPIVVVYKECLKNHAASLGGHALDGCGEFMPSPTATPTDPTSLKCAACGCHRNFHRREPDDPIPLPTTTTATTTQVIEYQPHHRHHPPPPPPRGHSPSPPSPPPISSSYYPSSAPHMLLALSAGLQGGPPPPPPDNPHSMGLFGTPTMAANTNSGTATNHNGRKRFRTRFSQGQKEKMYEFAERVEWKMQKKDEETVSEFCNEIGVDRSVLKVWMHNNKNSLGKKSSPPIPSSQADHHHLHQNHHHHLNGSSRNGTTFDQNDTTTTNNNNDEDEDDDENNIQQHHNGGTNGSSSSS